MSEINYVLGVSFAILAGCLSNFGNVLEKKAVVNIPKEERDENFGKKLLKNPIWLTGFILATLIDPIFFMMAQGYLGLELGPTLAPGLFAAGMIVLAIGSAKIIGEKLGKFEIFGIGLMILGIAFLGFSNLETGGVDIANQDLIARMTIFTIVVFIFLILSAYMSFKSKKDSYKGIILAISVGFAFVLSNFWISPLIASMDDVFTGRVFTGGANIMVFFIFLAAIIILMTTNFYGIARLQVCFKYADANKAIPINEVPQQISPIFVYFAVFLNVANPISTFLIIGGVTLIIISGFLLAQRQASLESIE